MSDSTQRIASDIDLMTEVAMLYYLENVTQEAIAKRFDLSRAKVSRLLKRARDEGIVEVRVLQHPAMNNELEQALVERFQLDRALIAVDHSDPDTQRSAVASLVANYLNNKKRRDLAMLEDEAQITVQVYSQKGAAPEHLAIQCLDNNGRELKFTLE